VESLTLAGESVILAAVYCDRVSDGPRSRSTLAQGLTRWWTAQYGTDQQRTVTVQRPQPGLSSDTLLVTIDDTAGRNEHVVRLPPFGDAVFPDYSLQRQADVQRTLASRGLPVVAPTKFEPDCGWLGAPFVVMPRIHGVSLSTAPPYTASGWLAEADPNTQLRVFDNFLELLAAVHRSPALTSPAGGGPTLDGMLDYWTAYLDWATADSPVDDAGRIYRDAICWLHDHRPTDPPRPSLLWGDPQLTNCVFDQRGYVVAALDWEMATTGPAEVDLAWFLTLHEQSTETAGCTLAGDPGRVELIARYEKHLGRTVDDLHWYDGLANLRSGAIVLRIGQLLARRGVDPSWTRQVPQPRHLQRLLQS